MTPEAHSEAKCPRCSSLPDKESLISQIVISKRGGRRKRPFVFTEHGTVMLASVLRSDRAISMSIEVVKAFVRLNKAISAQTDVAKEISEMRSFILNLSHKTDREFRKVWRAIDKLTKPIDENSGDSIGFRID